MDEPPFALVCGWRYPLLIIAKGGSFSTVSTLRLYSSTSLACGFSYEKGTAAQRCAAVSCMGVIAFYLPASSTASTAFWTWRRFSASSKISSACCSNRAVEISSPRWAGRQCSTSASGLAFSSRRPVS